MATVKEILPIASQVIQKFDLCDNCLGRLFSKQLSLSSNMLLGKKIQKNLGVHSTKCYVCKNLFSNLKPYLKLMLDSCSKYEYSSILVGAIIKPSIIDRDDYIRSKYKLRGIESVKTAITKELLKQFIKKTKKKIDFLDPEITFTLNFKDESCHVRSKSVLLQGNYIKTQRGLPQKQKSCTNCSGKGCRICHFHGITEFDSIEGKISHYLFSKFGGTTTKFTWIGGEDKSSLVLGSGRPFFVKILNPIKRRTHISKKINFDSIVIYNCKIISELPKKLPNFTSLIKLQISTQDEIDSKILRKLKQILKKSVIVYEKSGKRSEKVISNLKYKITSKHGFTLTIRAQGGLPVKRFVASDNVSLGISQILNTSCSCREFDFLNIELE